MARKIGNMIVTDKGEISLIDTLPAGSTSITFTDPCITDSKTIQIYTNVYGTSPMEITTENGSVTLTFKPREQALDIKLVIK